MKRFRVVHRTDYQYGRSMSDGFTVARVQPRAMPGQTLLSARLDVTPEPDEWDESVDAFGNRVVHFAVHHPHAWLSVVSTIEVDVFDAAPMTIDPPWESVVAEAIAATEDARLTVDPYLAHTAQTPRLAALEGLTGPVFTPGRGVVDATRALCATIFREFRFDAMATDLATPLTDVLAGRHGVCQDFAHVTVAALRSIGLPARYVSGYVESLPPPGEPRLIGVDASHAWCAVWAGSALGWLDLDPTNDQMPPERHVTVGWGRDYDDVAPVRGVVIGPTSAQSLYVSVDVAEITSSLP